jgi:hypothetical protein
MFNRLENAKKFPINIIEAFSGFEKLWASQVVMAVRKRVRLDMGYLRPVL